MALGLEITRLLPLFPNSVFLQWDLVSPAESGTYTFQVDRSGSPAGPWTSVLGATTGIYSCVDAAPTTGVEQPPVPAPANAAPNPQDFNLLSMARALYYRVTVTPPSGSSNAVATISEVEPRLSGKQRLLRRKMLRDASMAFKKLNGVEIAVLKRVRWGPRCPKCFDPYTKESVRGACSNCFGTGFFPAYYAPVVTLGRRGTRPSAKQITPQGATEYRPTQATLLDVPKVDPDDILVFLRDNKRFIVKTTIETELQNVGVHQKFEISEIARSSPEYRLVADTLRTPPLF